MKDIQTIREEACEKVQMFLDLNNLDNETWKRLRWGHIIVYTYFHSEDYLEEFVTFDNEEEAELYLQSILDEWAMDPNRDVDPLTQFPKGIKLDEKDIEYYRIKDWDKPIRRGVHLGASKTIGLANSWVFVNTLPIEMLRELTTRLFDSNVIPGYYDE